MRIGNRQKTAIFRKSFVILCMICLNDTETAFRLKSNSELRRAYWLFRLIAGSWLVRIASIMISIINHTGLPLGWIVKPAVYRQFCGGENLEECLPVVKKLALYNVKSILDYSVEGKVEDENIEKSLMETLRSIEFAGNYQNIPFSVFKPTAFAKPWVLEELSINEQPSETAVREGERFRTRVKLLCEKACEVNKPILIDAEYSYYQKFIDKVVMEMMWIFNREKAVVFNTYQMYRRDRMEVLIKDCALAESGNFFLGAKFVRGAYMEKERARAGKMDYPDPIHPEKGSTDNDYNNALRFSVQNIQRISIFNGTHNEESSLLLTELMEENGIDKDDSRVWFSQLYGMSDHISFNLAAAGYNVAKYLPYGPVRHVLPYLIRRVEENTSVKGATGRELDNIMRERRRRKGVKWVSG